MLSSDVTAAEDNESGRFLSGAFVEKLRRIGEVCVDALTSSKRLGDFFRAIFTKSFLQTAAFEKTRIKFCCSGFASFFGVPLDPDA